MKIVLLSTSESIGGAAIAAKRLMAALNKVGCEAKLLVRNKQTTNPLVIPVHTSCWGAKIDFCRFIWERIVIFFSNHLKRKNLFSVSIANTGIDITQHPLVKEADIIHLHWINQGFLSLSGIKKLMKLGKPVVWTMHDMWLCTGICHHAWECTRFEHSCGKCPFLMSKREKDFSYRILRKKQFLPVSAIRIVTVSSWLKQVAEKSSLMQGLNISVIPNMIDITAFSPTDKQAARKQFSFPLTKKIVLMGAAKLNDPIKGFEYLKEALSLLRKGIEDIYLVLFGKIKDAPSFLSDIPVEYAFMGSLSDTSIISQLYSAADVTVVPSYYETFGQTLIESLACGCPVVSFNNSGQTDIIDHKVNGYLAEYKSAEDLANGIHWVLMEADYAELSRNAIDKVRQTYDEAIIAGKYEGLYEEIVSKQVSH